MPTAWQRTPSLIRRDHPAFAWYLRVALRRSAPSADTTSLGVLLVEILRYVAERPEDLARVDRTCRTLSYHVADSSLWRGREFVARHPPGMHDLGKLRGHYVFMRQLAERIEDRCIVEESPGILRARVSGPDPRRTPGFDEDEATEGVVGASFDVVRSLLTYRDIWLESLELDLERSTCFTDLMSAVGDDPEKCFDIRNLRVRAYDLPGFYPRNPVRDEEATSIRKLLQRLSRLDLDSVRTLELRDDYAHDLDLEPTWSDMSDDDREHHAREHPDVEDHRSDLDLGPRSLAFTVDTRLPAVRELRLLGGREYPQLPLWIIEPGPPARVFANVEVLHLGPAWRIQGCHLAAGIPTVVRSLAELRELHVVLPEDSASAFRETAWDVLRPVCCILAPRLELVAVDAHPSEAELGDGEWLARRIHGVLGERRRNGLVVPERLSRFRYARQEFAVRPFFERPQSFAQ